MKRDYSDDGPAPSKRHRYNDEEVTFLIPSKVAGSIIGKGGSNISKLRSQFKASITVPDCPGPERVLSIVAADLESVLSIMREVLPCLTDNVAEELDLRLIIHNSQAGCIIGKAGAKIKELREKTGARVKVFASLAPQSTGRIVQLVGSEETINAGLREVLEILQQTPAKNTTSIPYDPHNYDDYYADQYGGYGNGQGGALRGPRGPRGAPPPRGMHPMGGPGRGPMAPPGPMRSGPMGPPRGYNDFSGPSGPRNNYNTPPRRFGGGNYGGGNFGGGRNGGNFNDNGNGSGGQQEQTTQVTIPKDLAGAIIGKSGSRIRKIRAESGAGIEIAEPLPGANDRIITISGTPQRIQMAQYLLQQSVHESNPGLTRGGNNF